MGMTRFMKRTGVERRKKRDKEEWEIRKDKGEKKTSSTPILLQWGHIHHVKPLKNAPISVTIPLKSTSQPSQKKTVIVEAKRGEKGEAKIRVYSLPSLSSSSATSS